MQKRNKLHINYNNKKYYETGGIKIEFNNVRKDKKLTIKYRQAGSLF